MKQSKLKQRWWISATLLFAAALVVPALVTADDAAKATADSAVPVQTQATPATDTPSPDSTSPKGKTVLRENSYTTARSTDGTRSARW